MNLVCKEFVAARDDEQGALILSRFAGAAREMTEALIVNPYHVEETADALHRAATMPAAEQRERMASLRMTVRENNVFRWAGHMLTDAGRSRLRERIEARVQAPPGRLTCAICFLPKATRPWSRRWPGVPCSPSTSTARWRRSSRVRTTPAFRPRSSTGSSVSGARLPLAIVSGRRVDDVR